MTHIKTCSMQMWMLLVVCVYGLELVNCQGPCTTPYNAVGECIHAKSCQAMVDFLNSLQESISDENRVILEKYFYCRPGYRYSVCCPKNGSILPHVEKSSVSLIPFPATPSLRVPNSLPAPVTFSNDILKHRNLHLLPLKNCGYYNVDMVSDNKITKGDNATLNEFPWMALLSYYDPLSGGTTFNCGGTIINDRYILTAAHCIEDLRLRVSEVRLGEYNIATEKDCMINDFGNRICASPVQDIPVEKVILHSNYNAEKFENDIALLRLRNKINFTDNIQPICLPVEKAAHKSRNFLIVSGWGYLNNDHIPSSILQKAKLPLVNREKCEAAYNGEVKISHKQICAGARDGQGTCQGDSGGPLQILLHLDAVDDVAYVQVGVVSYGPRLCGSVRIPEVYTKVSYYMEWILNQLEP